MKENDEGGWAKVVVMLGRQGKGGGGWERKEGEREWRRSAKTDILNYVSLVGQAFSKFLCAHISKRRNT